ncbi:MAG: histidine phosphatase family protein [Chitinophagaceae bacterium]|nr:histidine phosphatase family protein [Chitinophagaceae bacterium]MCA6512343.1 histidine phosphatase family protein [Chitinophagaceae bacterium]
MKRLLLIRHAKTHPALAGQKDFDRKLNERGLADAPRMAQRLLDRGIDIDGFYSSPASRAFATASFFAAASQLPPTAIQTFPSFYHPHPADIFQKISEFPDRVRTAAIFAHNPGLTDFVNQLSDIRIDHLPTCGIFAVAADIQHWSDFGQATRYFFFFDQPKEGGLFL